MPVINGTKMACEPCIRGHRSTKCTHATERLMVQVRKPGRPLSACPHPCGQSCGCGSGSVTAAIPRKQACHCGSSTPTQGIHGNSQVAAPSSAEVTSPIKPNFKVQKSSSRPQSSRKQSYDPANLERMRDQVNIIQTPTTISGGYAVSSPSQTYGFPPQFAQPQQFAPVAMMPPPYLQPINGNDLNGYSNGHHAPLEQLIESPGATSLNFERIGPENYANKTLNGVQTKVVTNMNGNGENISNGGSCCAPKPKNHAHSSSNGSTKSEYQAPKVASCCTPKAEPVILKQEPMTNGHNTPQIPHQSLPPNGLNLSTNIWPQYPQQQTVFTYPPTYGSWQNPLDPSAWRQSLQANQFTANLGTTPLPYGTPVIPEAPADTVHTCCCGDGCECIGCAAHPYNDATQKYVRSAYALSTADSDLYHTNGNGHRSQPSLTNGQTLNHSPSIDAITSPNSNSPTSSTAGEQEQNLPEGDFLFVKYSLGEGAGCFGEVEQCPCGDDCACLGCTIHKVDGFVDGAMEMGWNGDLS